MAASLARAWNGHWKSAKSSSERDVHVGVEYETGEHEYHGLLADPYELHDTYGSLAPEQRAVLETALAAIQDCHDANACWAAQHVAPRRWRDAGRNE
jgi:hypothetical protein